MRPDPEVGTVYFAVSEAGDRVKIGFTFGDALARVAALRHDDHYPEPYELKALVTPVSRAVETALHILYRDDRCRDVGRAREIFHFSPRLQALVSAIQADPHGAITAVLQPSRPDRFEPPQRVSVWEGPSWDASPLAKVGETERLSAFLLPPSVSDTRVTVAVDGPALATLSFSSWPRPDEILTLPAEVSISPASAVAVFHVLQEVRSIPYPDILPWNPPAKPRVANHTSVIAVVRNPRVSMSTLDHLVFGWQDQLRDALNAAERDN